MNQPQEFITIDGTKYKLTPVTEDIETPESNTDPLLKKSINLAKKAHFGQYRKDNSLQFDHCLRVMKRVQSFGLGIEEQCAAVLHDILEDTPMDYHSLTSHTNSNIADYVSSLTKPTKGNRKDRMLEYRNKIRTANTKIKLIKLADMEDNTSNMICLDNDFMPIYVAEMTLMIMDINMSHVSLTRKIMERLFGEVMNFDIHQWRTLQKELS